MPVVAPCPLPRNPAAAQAVLFGSRVDDSKRGGDIDLCVLAMPRHRFGNALAGAVRIL